MSIRTSAIPLRQGVPWEELKIGQHFRTLQRTVTETDLVNVIGVTGQYGVMFIDVEFRGAIKGGRPVPAALTYSLIEGMLMQTMLQCVGLAMLEMTQRIKAPVLVGDSIHGDVEITGLRQTSKGGRAIVDSHITVVNQSDVVVLEYDVKRLQAGRAG